MALADAAEHWSETVDLDQVEVDWLQDLAAVAAAVDARDQAEETLTASVVAARSNGRSWTEIAVRLGVSRQAARQKYAAALPDVAGSSRAASRSADVKAGRNHVAHGVTPPRFAAGTRGRVGS